MPLSNEYFCAIGRVAVSFSRLEAEVAFLANRLKDPTGKTSSLNIDGDSFNVRLKSLQKLATAFSGLDQDTLDAMIGQARALSKRRAQVVHAFWIEPLDARNGGLVPFAMGHTSARNIFGTDVGEMTPDDITNLAVEILECGEAFNLLRGQLPA